MFGGLIRRHIAGYHVYLGAGRAKSLVPMKCLVRIAMGFSQDFYFLHLMVVFFGVGKKFEQSGFKQPVRLGRPSKELLPPRT